MKTKIIIAVLFCASLFAVTSCSNTANNAGTTNDSTGTSSQSNVQQLIDILNIHSDVDVPSVNFAAEGIYFHIDADVNADVDSLVKRIMSGATISTKSFSFSLKPVGPGQAKASVQLFFPKKQSS